MSTSAVAWDVNMKRTFTGELSLRPEEAAGEGDDDVEAEVPAAPVDFEACCWASSAACRLRLSSSCSFSS